MNQRLELIRTLEGPFGNYLSSTKKVNPYEFPFSVVDLTSCGIPAIYQV